jgi:hypothetical protein
MWLLPPPLLKAHRNVVVGSFGSGHVRPVDHIALLARDLRDALFKRLHVGQSNSRGVTRRPPLRLLRRFSTAEARQTSSEAVLGAGNDRGGRAYTPELA